LEHFYGTVYLILLFYVNQGLFGRDQNIEHFVREETETRCHCMSWPMLLHPCIIYCINY